MDELQDNGWIIGLPAGWVCAKIATVRYYRLLQDRAAGEDLAPWLEVPHADKSGPIFGLSPQQFTASAKLNERVSATFQRALLNGDLCASMFDGSSFKALPKAAFTNLSVVANGLTFGVLEIDPLWPDEWWPNNGHGWAFPKAQFEGWLSSPDAFRVQQLPADTFLPERDTIAPINVREPSQRRRVTLSEAVSWVAFGVALDADRLERALQWDRLAEGDLQEVQRKIAAAGASVLAYGADEKIAFFGHHVESKLAKGAENAPIDPLHLDDYRSFMIGHDDLYYGEGLHRTYRAKNDTQLKGSDRRDLFTQVTLSRADLMRYFPPKADNMKALEAALPATLPDIGPVMGLAEAIHWKAHGRPSFDTKVWRKADGALVFSDPDGNEIATNTVGQQTPHMVAFLGASRECWTALQEGLIAGIIAPADGPPLHVPRLYWNKVASEYLDLVYAGMAPGEVGIGCPILVSRAQFDNWRAASSTVEKPADPPKAGKYKGGDEKRDKLILEAMIALKAETGLDGRAVAQMLPKQSGFGDVAVTFARTLIDGQFKQGSGRLKLVG